MHRRKHHIKEMYTLNFRCEKSIHHEEKKSIHFSILPPQLIWVCKACNSTRGKNTNEGIK